MNAVVVYYSEFGNTKQVAEAIAETLQAVGPVRVMDIEQFTAAHFKDAGLVVMGTPTHKMNLPQAVRPVLEALPKGCLRGIATAAFDTSYKMSSLLNRFTASKRLNRSLRKLGGRPLVPPETFLVVERQGPLYEGEIERAKAWAETILDGYRHVSENQHAGRE